MNNTKTDTSALASNKSYRRGYPKTLISGKDASCFLRVTQVIELLAVAKSTLYKMVKEGRFPRPYKQGDRIVVWKREDIDTYINKICKESGRGGDNHDSL